MKSKPTLCSKNQCTGCAACANICPMDCIRMEADHEGFLQPEIKYDLCKACGICEKICPVINRPKLNRLEQPKVYACWHKNEEVRLRSSSGGLFSALAKIFLEQKGVVFGAAYDEMLHVRHICIEHIDDLDKLRRSKYVQSEIGDAFRQVKQFLLQQRKVLFVGTPCQIAGLHSYLGTEFENLLSVDLICGGAPSPKVFSGYISFIERSFATSLTDLNFRDKRHGWENNAVVATSDEKHYHLKGSKNNFYFASYILHYTLRNSCFRCPATGLPRMGEITIADFWGIKKDAIISQGEVDKGISLLMINNNHEKISAVISRLLSVARIYEKSFEEAKSGNGPMFNCPQEPKGRDAYFQDFNRYGYKESAKKYLRYPFKKRIIQFIKENAGAGILSRMRRLKQLTRL